MKEPVVEQKSAKKNPKKVHECVLSVLFKGVSMLFLSRLPVLSRGRRPSSVVPRWCLPAAPARPSWHVDAHPLAASPGDFPENGARPRATMEQRQTNGIKHPKSNMIHHISE